MVKHVVWMAVFLSATLVADDKQRAEFEEVFGQMIAASPVACDQGLPPDCVCAAFNSQTDLPMRYSQVQSCPHPVLEEIRNFTSYTSDGTLIDDLMMKNGQLHGAVVSWHPNGKLHVIANYDEGRQIGFSRVWHDNGMLAAEQQFADGKSDGVEMRYAIDGTLDWIVVWNHGEVDREVSRALNQAQGLVAPFDRPSPGRPDSSVTE